MMAKRSMSSSSTGDYRETICLVRCDVILQEQHSTLQNEFFDYCSRQHVLPVFDFKKKQLHLFGPTAARVEAEKRFLEIENELLVQINAQQNTQGVLWWYEAWDGTWQTYNSPMTIEIETHRRKNVTHFILSNTLGERVSFDLSKQEEIYGQRRIRIRRSTVDEHQPHHWTLTPNALEQYSLSTDSTEFSAVKSDFDQTMRGVYTTVLSIERIQNVRLFKQFSVHHEHFLNKYGRETNGTLTYLYHGCPEPATKGIVERGFSRSYCGTNGCVYGRGVYFSTSAQYSHTYATSNNKKERRMFYSRVLIGKSMIGYSTIREPTNECDSTTDGKHIYVCYHDSQCYPEYLLTYI